MSLKALLDTLPIPILQAPMLGVSDHRLALAVSEAGGMGAFAGAGLAGADLGPAIAALKAQTERPFNVNLLITRPVAPGQDEIDLALARLAPWYAQSGAPLPEIPNQYAPDFEGQFSALIQAAPPVASFAFDVLTAAQVAALQAAGTYVIGTATTVAEAKAWAEVGADGVCAQGYEAGGHRGHFLADVGASLVGLLPLVATIRAVIDLPVIAAGGIMDGRGVAAVLALGASAAQMGTAFLLSDQATTSSPWRQALAAAPDEATRLTRAFTGRHARGLENRFMREMRSDEDLVPAYPVQNRLTQPLRAASTAAGDPEQISLWAGQGARLAATGDAGARVLRWWEEAKAASSQLSARLG
ncbi:NAD(P)H-dependent flavin oxidoreductase [Phenylobacterium immobile]|uniref:NAD(P)H-dependent flavin oxidoreductase n=1 Tax=Phenylobacterium immobile TaxID=21 RepID=UPI000B24A823|nr:nitronate monooxygenase [Phenylobacterium immobile]